MDKKIVFKTIRATKKGVNNHILEGYEEIIDEYINQGYFYLGFVPKEYNGLGVPIQIDLMFRK